MGAVSFSLDERLVLAIKDALDLKIFIETGTFRGDTVALMIPHFEYLHSVELSVQLYEEAVARFKGEPKVELYQGHSQAIVGTLCAANRDRSVLYWLDAHWCLAQGTAGETSQCPLLEEISAIGALNPNSVLLIDDARLFLAPPAAPHETSQWPRFHEVLIELLKISKDHEIMVVNDVIAFFPGTVRRALEAYAGAHGINWHAAALKLEQSLGAPPTLEDQIASVQKQANDLTNIIEQQLDKDQVMTDLCMALNAVTKTVDFVHHAASIRDAVNKRQTTGDISVELAKLQDAVVAKEAVISELSEALAAFRAARFRTRAVNFVRRAANRGKELFRPRIGVLNQYEPRQLTLAPKPASATVLANYPKISLVTPAYQHGGYIEATLRSVLDQHYPNLEYYIHDGGSTDDTAAILKNFEKRLTGWQSFKDNGQSHAINLGFAQTSGELMAWLNSDDLLLPGSLVTVAAYFNSNPEVDVVYGNRLMIDENGMEIGRWILPGHSDRVLLIADYVPQETLFWRRSIWEKSGGKIDESYRFAMDWDLLIRLREAGARFAHIPEFLGAFRIHAAQKTSTQINEIGAAEMSRIRLRTLGRIPTDEEIRKALRPFLAKHVATDLAFRVKRRVGALGNL